ncbi:MAG: hypothetical protein Q4A64_03430 [Porphyromonadaceae bacterium]|nr:hypothetical protein [Porphyromonadaceae bacterium]
MLRLLSLSIALLLVGCRVKRTSHETTTEQATRTLEVSRLSRLAEVRTDVVVDYSRAHIIEYDTAGRVMREIRTDGSRRTESTTSTQQTDSVQAVASERMARASESHTHTDAEPSLGIPWYAWAIGVSLSVLGIATAIYIRARRR